MAIKEEVRLVIEDYFTVTGRPLATMTVDEYLKFCDYAKMHTETERFQDGPHEDKRPVVATGITPSQSELSVSMQPSNTETVATKTVTKTKPSKEEMLQLLRSVDS